VAVRGPGGEVLLDALDTLAQGHHLGEGLADDLLDDGGDPEAGLPRVLDGAAPLRCG
jgi:hypothetical protein